MIKVVSNAAMSTLESLAYQQGYTADAFMEKAGQQIAKATQQFAQIKGLSSQVILLCGKGNNGGDTFVAGRYLLQDGFIVKAVQLEKIERCSPLCQKNQRLFVESGGIIIQPPFYFEEPVIFLDGLFGTGFHGEIQEPCASLIEAVNRTKFPVLAIDIPSGLNGTTGQVEGIAIHATKTLFLGLPKMGFFLEKGWNIVGDLEQIHFGLPSHIIEQECSFYQLISDDQLPSLPPIRRNRHKYEAGYVIGIAGSIEMPGAAYLSSLAALRGGSGMVKMMYPAEMRLLPSINTPEAVRYFYTVGQEQNILSLIEKAKAIFVGPGLGRENSTIKLLQTIVPNLAIPCVIDADALYCFARDPFKLPSQVIFTPHLGEMQTLLNTSAPLSITQETLEICQKYAEQQHITLVLKGAPTFVFYPNSPILINPTGNPGMATAGSGDVLTGLLASLLAQGLTCHQAAILGVYLHGLAGEYAVTQRKTPRGLLASDLIQQFENVYEWFERM